VGGVFGVLFQTPFLSPIRFDDSAHMVSIRLVKAAPVSQTSRIVRRWSLFV
jgi:hypothetical protein